MGPFRVATRILLVGLLAAAAGLGWPAGERGAPASRAQPAVELRIALVIGNGDYPNAPLANPVNDARAVAERLGTLGFRVARLENASQEQMYEAIRTFGDTLRRGGGVGLFYYAGHALQVRGRNYLLPVRAMIEREDEILYRTVDTGVVLDKMENARNRVNIVILDACRNNPFGREFRNVAPGLAVVDAPSNTLIAFATAPGAVASDGSGTNGLYTQHLLQAMAEPGMRLEDAFKKVRSGVRRDSAGRQVPWESTSLEVDFFFRPAPPVATAPATPAVTPTATAAPAAPVPSPSPPPPPDPLTIELAFWESLKGSTDPEDYRAYLRRYPEGQFASLARNRLRAQAAAPAVAPSGATAAAAATPTAPPAPPAPATTPAPSPTATAQPVVTAAAPPGMASGNVPTALTLPHSAPVVAVALSRSGTQALTAAADRSLRLWDVAGGARELRRLAADAPVTALALAPDGRRFLAGRSDGGLALWDVASSSALARWGAQGARTTALAIGPTGRYAISGADNGELLLWDLTGGTTTARAQAGTGRVRALALSTEGRFLLSAGDDGWVRLWDVGQLRALRSFGPLPAAVVAVAFGDQGRRVLAVDLRGEVRWWNAADGAGGPGLATGSTPPARAALAPDGTGVLVAGADGTLAWWDLATGTPRWRTAPGTQVAALLTAGPAGSVALSAADDARVLLWPLATLPAWAPAQPPAKESR